MIKKICLLFIGMVLSCAVAAASVQMASNHPNQYIVKKGDTLWDIAGVFLQHPWEWPKIWHKNPYIKNPHWIYPGDVLNLVYEDGAPLLKLSPGVHEGKIPVAPIPLDDLRAFLEDQRVMDADQLKQMPYAMAFEENRVHGTVGDYVYVRGGESMRAGDEYFIVRPTHAFRQYSIKDKDLIDTPTHKINHAHVFRQRDNGDGTNRIAHELDGHSPIAGGPWKENFRHDGHKGHGTMLGIGVTTIGRAKVISEGDPASLLIQSSNKEIRKGDRLIPKDDVAYDSQYVPHAPSDVPSDSRVIALAEGLHAGAHQVITLSIGSEDGVENGDTFSIFRPGVFVDDTVAHHSNRTSISKKVKLPDEYVGHVMVFRTFDKVSFGLVKSALRPVQEADKLQLPLID